MLTPIFIQEKLKLILDGQLKHSYYDESITIAKEIEETFSDVYPEFLNVNRPKESKKDKDYRKAIFSNPVKGDLGRILDKLIKVEQSEDFSVNYPIEDGVNKLMDYCESKFNGSNNLVNYVFTKGTNTYIKNPNAVIAVLDVNPPQSQTESFKPYPKIFLEKDVLEFEKTSHCILKEEISKDVTKIYFIDEVAYYIITIDEVGNRERISLTGPILHYCSEMPAFKVGQHIAKDESNGNELFKSLVSDSLPHFRKAIARSSDIEIELNHHVHTLEWQMAPKKCPTCKGKTFEDTKDGRVECRTCKGTGTTSWGNLDILTIDTYEDKFLEGQSKFPFNSPGGYVPRNIEAVRELKVSYYNHIEDAYEVLDYGILRKKDANNIESGLSKQYNRLEYSQKIYSEGRHLIENVLIRIYKFIDCQLFGINPDNMKSKRIPDITIPISFDVMSPEMILEEIKTAKESGASAKTVKTLEIKYSKLVFGENSDEVNVLMDEISLNPCLGMSVSDMTTLFGGGSLSSTNGLSQESYIIGSNFKYFIDKAIREESKWKTFDNSKKYEILVKYANELISQRPQIPTLPVVEVI